MSKNRGLWARVGTAAVLAGALALVGCGMDSSAGGSGKSEEAAQGSALLPAAEGKVTYPLTLETPWGKTELKQRPTRIAAVTPSQDDVEVLAALGVTPYLAGETTEVWVEEALAQPIPKHFTRGDEDIPVEQVAAAEPDLIIVLGTDLAENYEKLSAIAPVLATAQAGAAEARVANDWSASVKRVGEALDLKDAAEKALDDQSKFFADFRTEHPEFTDVTASYVVYYGADNGLQFHSAIGSPSELVLEGMGLAPAPRAAELKYRQDISNELLSSIDADVILFSENSDGAHKTLTEQPLFQQLGAVKAGKLMMFENFGGTYAIDGELHQGNLPWALARSGPLSSVWAAEQLAPELSAVVEGK